MMNESSFAQWVERVERLQNLLWSIEQQVRDRKPTEWIGTDDVCKMLGIGRRTVHSLRESGRLPFSKLEHKIYYRAEDVYCLMNSLMVNSETGMDGTTAIQTTTNRVSA